MKTIGSVLKEARLAKGMDIAVVARDTKIKPEFIRALEHESWEKLPELPVVTGFVKNLAPALGVSRDKALALLRRDYPPKTVSLSPKPDVSPKLWAGPRVAFALGIISVLAVVGAYLGVQYKSFISPPALEVVAPKDEETVTAKQVEVVGTTDPNATVRVNNQPALVERDGSFSVIIDVAEDTRAIEIKSVSRSGQETVVNRNIKVVIENQ